MDIGAGVVVVVGLPVGQGYMNDFNEEIVDGKETSSFEGIGGDDVVWDGGGGLGAIGLLGWALMVKSE